MRRGSTVQANSRGKNLSEASRTAEVSSPPAGRGFSASVTTEFLQQYYDLPIDEAARKCGVSTTIVKRACRRLGIHKWPYRKINSVEKQLQNTAILLCRSRGSERTKLEAKLHKLQGLRGKLVRDAKTPDGGLHSLMTSEHHQQNEQINTSTIDLSAILPMEQPGVAEMVHAFNNQQTSSKQQKHRHSTDEEGDDSMSEGEQPEDVHHTTLSSHSHTTHTSQEIQSSHTLTHHHVSAGSSSNGQASAPQVQVQQPRKSSLQVIMDQQRILMEQRKFQQQHLSSSTSASANRAFDLGPTESSYVSFPHELPAHVTHFSMHMVTHSEGAGAEVN